jgi:hypothetical protein
MPCQQCMFYMKPNQRRWIIAIIIFQLLTAAIHSTSHFIKPPPPANESEKQFLDLFNNYRTDMGGGFDPSMAEVFLAISIAFTLLFVFGGLINIFLLRSKAAMGTVKGLIAIQTLIYGGCFITTAALTFLPPIICTALIFGACIGAFISFRKSET